MHLTFLEIRDNFYGEAKPLREVRIKGFFLKLRSRILTSESAETRRQTAPSPSSHKPSVYNQTRHIEPLPSPCINREGRG